MKFKFQFYFCEIECLSINFFSTNGNHLKLFKFK